MWKQKICSIQYLIPPCFGIVKVCVDADTVISSFLCTFKAELNDPTKEIITD